MTDLEERINHLKTSLQIESKTTRVSELESVMSKSETWDSPDQASEYARELSELKTIVDGWQHVYEMVEAGGEEDRAEIEQELAQLELETLLNGPHDAAPAIVSIHAGTGGVDAMDWAEMLYKMYVRYAEAKGYQLSTLDLSRAEEAGIKSVPFRVSGHNVYGYLRGEAGVHRLVRLSPFNAKHLRQTSFALVEVIPEIAKQAVEIPEKDLRIDAYRGSGHGGQGVNTTDSAVRIAHIPTNTVVTCQNERSQLQNRESAMKILQSRLVTLLEAQNETELSKLKPNVQGSWGNQIRSYVMQPYTLVKDHRTNVETSDVTAVLNGDLELFIQAELRLPR